MRNKKIIGDNEELYNKVCDANIQSVGEDIQNNIYNEDEDNAEENIIPQSIEIRRYSSYEHDNNETLPVSNISVTNTDHSDENKSETMCNDTTNEYLEEQNLRASGVNITLKDHNDEEEPASILIDNTDERKKKPNRYSIRRKHYTNCLWRKQ